MTTEFTRGLTDRFAGDLHSREGDTNDVVDGLYAWLQDRMFKASTTAFMGSRLLSRSARIFLRVRSSSVDHVLSSSKA